MGKYSGPCDRCGEYVERYIRQGRGRYHPQCGIEAAAEHNISMAMGTNPQLAKSIVAGRLVGAELREQRGPYYARWVAGLAAYANARIVPRLSEDAMVWQAEAEENLTEP